ncbi:ABC transporter ATP-binding protein [Ruegeria arenilitoris]|uniref:ABC transporter ATP-binding protein n=1 Tax=Ruegeria arenilitoris TaxID=1173585 RepID=UPI00147A6941|nr:ABC transporter ATP-binding protein [Ruegeria arenilitoris]
MDTPIAVNIADVSKSFGQFEAVKNVDLQLKQGEFFSLLGPSGCGKSTLLRMIAGFEDPTEGSITIDGREMKGIEANHRPTNMVFQSYAIFPHLNVEENIVFGLARSGLSKGEKRAKANEMLEKVGLAGLGRRGAHELSGGQRQRVALARALVLEPKVLLLDEPMSALDKKLREQMQMELRALQRSVGITFLMVTHDQHEAMTISDRCGVMFGGKLAQVDAPEILYQAPRTKQVADFIGGMNFIEGQIGAHEGGSLEIDLPVFGKVSVDEHGVSERAGAPITIGLRPERIHVEKNRPEGADVFAEAEVVDRAFYGETIHYYLALNGRKDPIIASITNFERREHFEIGEKVWSGFRGAAAVALPQD